MNFLIKRSPFLTLLAFAVLLLTTASTNPDLASSLYPWAVWVAMIFLSVPFIASIPRKVSTSIHAPESAWAGPLWHKAILFVLFSVWLWRIISWTTTHQMDKIGSTIAIFGAFLGITSIGGISLGLQQLRKLVSRK